jgi:hypothetical protein
MFTEAEYLGRNYGQRGSLRLGVTWAVGVLRIVHDDAHIIENFNNTQHGLDKVIYTANLYRVLEMAKGHIQTRFTFNNMTSHDRQVTRS